MTNRDVKSSLTATRYLIGTQSSDAGGGSPEGVVTAVVGSSYFDTTNGVVYLKTVGSGNTGWCPVSGPTVFNDQVGTTYTHVLSDQGKTLTFNNASEVVFTIDTNANAACPVGTKIILRQLGAGPVKVVAAGGVTLLPASPTYLKTQYDQVVLEKTATNTWFIPAKAPSKNRGGGSLRTAAVTQTFSRPFANANLALLTSGTILVVPMDTEINDVISSLTFMCRTTPLSGGSNQWACVLDQNSVVKAVSADGTSGAWASNSEKTFTMGSSFIIPDNNQYYFGLMINATTVPTLVGALNGIGVVINSTPRLSSYSSTGQTTPPSVGASLAALSSISGVVGIPWAYAS